MLFPPINTPQHAQVLVEESHAETMKLIELDFFMGMVHAVARKLTTTQGWCRQNTLTTPTFTNIGWPCK